MKDGEVTLSGSVPTRDMKRTAEDMIEHLPGVRDVANQLRVRREEQGVTDRAAGNGDVARKGTGLREGGPRRWATQRRLSRLEAMVAGLTRGSG